MSPESNNSIYPLLSINIPTWNRSDILKESLTRIQRQLKEIDGGVVEINISDNCSTDDTAAMIRGFIEDGMPINYECNEVNIGGDRNIFKCLQTVGNGRFVWTLGDDDFIRPGALSFIVNTLKENPDIGLFHLSTTKGKAECMVFPDTRKFIKTVSFYFSFISANIFRRELIPDTKEFELYLDTNLSQMPFYITAACLGKKNILVGIDHIMEPGVDEGNNGGYNFFRVFVKNYLDIMHTFLYRYGYGGIFSYLQRKVFTRFTIRYVDRLLVCKEDNISANLADGKGRKGWNVDNAWYYLFHYYKYKPYFYTKVFKCYFNLFFKR